MGDDAGLAYVGYIAMARRCGLKPARMSQNLDQKDVIDQTHRMMLPYLEPLKSGRVPEVVDLLPQRSDFGDYYNDIFPCERHVRFV